MRSVTWTPDCQPDMMGGWVMSIVVTAADSSWLLMRCGTWCWAIIWPEAICCIFAAIAAYVRDADKAGLVGGGGTRERCQRGVDAARRRS